VKNNNCYDMKTVHRCNTDILILIEIFVHENVERVGVDLHFHRAHTII